MNAQEAIAKFGMFWPDGNPGELRRAAAACRQAATDLGIVRDACKSTGSFVQGANQGPPIDAFASYLARWQSDPGYFPAAISASNQLADACESFAQKIEEAISRIVEIAIAAAATIAVGLVLTVFTFGASDVTAAAAVAGYVAATFAEGSALAAAAAEVGFMVAAGALEGVVFDGIVQVGAVWVFHDQKRFSVDELGKSALFGAATAGLASGAGSALRAGSRLIPALAGGSTMAGRTLNALDRIPPRLRTTITGGLFAAGVDEIQTGHVSPLDVIIGAGTGRLFGDAAARRVSGPELTAGLEGLKPGTQLDHLPNAGRARVDPSKFSGYSMLREHPQNNGKWKAWAAVGYDVDTPAGRAAATRDVSSQLAAQLPRAPATLQHSAQGPRFETRTQIVGPNGTVRTLVAVWQYDSGSAVPRLITNWLGIH